MKKTIEGRDVETSMVKISTINVGDVIIWYTNGIAHLKTISKINLNYCSFMGASIDGQCNPFSNREVEKVVKLGIRSI